MYIYTYIFFSLSFYYAELMMGSLPKTFYEIKVCSFLNKDVKLHFVRFRLRIETARQAAQSSELFISGYVFLYVWKYSASCFARFSQIHRE